VTSRLLFVVLDLLHRSLRIRRIAASSHVVGRHHDAGLGGAMVASAFTIAMVASTSTIAAVVSAGTIVTETVVDVGTIVTVTVVVAGTIVMVTVTIVAIVVATIVAITIVAITIATVASTASAGGILDGVTSLAQTIAARLVLHTHCTEVW
jgi:hypothetical protein